MLSEVAVWFKIITISVMTQSEVNANAQFEMLADIKMVIRHSSPLPGERGLATAVWKCVYVRYVG